MNRRQALAGLGALSGTLLLPFSALSREKTAEKKFRYCLNTSTIRENANGILEFISVAGDAGYDGIEIWVRDVRAFLEQGGRAATLRQALADQGLVAENAIGFAPWLSGPVGLEEMHRDMDMLAEVGCRRVAAPAMGGDLSQPLDLFEMAGLYNQLLDLGRRTGVMPQLEFWGASDRFWHLGQAAMVLCISGDPDARLLPDVYHLFRGGTDFNALDMINGRFIDVFHLNDYPDPAELPRTDQTDADRVYPGDGAAPLSRVLNYLDTSPGEKVLSLELFHPAYWKQDARDVASTGLRKMKEAVEKAGLA
ncbi:MAG: sugar phosphate isomerase/epimerase [Bacteroidales bacterium]